MSAKVKLKMRGTPLLMVRLDEEETTRFILLGVSPDMLADNESIW